MDYSNINTFLNWIYPTRLEEFRNKRVLDAGCGMGGHIRFVAKYAKEVVGIDEADGAVTKAKRLTKDLPNVEIIKADINTVNFKKKFDNIYCAGVLPHLENPKKGFDNLVKQLKKGGKINIWVISKEGNTFMIKLINPLKKAFFLKLPFNVLMHISSLLTLLLYVQVYSIYLLPINLPYKEYFKLFRKQSFANNRLNVFDKLNAPIIHWITQEEVRDWFKNLEEVHISDYNGISWRASGRNPKNR